MSVVPECRTLALDRGPKCACFHRTTAQPRHWARMKVRPGSRDGRGGCSMEIGKEDPALSREASGQIRITGSGIKAAGDWPKHAYLAQGVCL